LRESSTIAAGQQQSGGQKGKNKSRLGHGQKSSSSVVEIVTIRDDR
jgi:hypothetical protein